MKRSHYVALLAMGASALALTACGESETPAGVYTSVDRCIEDKVYTEKECADAFEKAREAHKDVAPKYAAREDCEADFGKEKCETSTTTRTTTGGVSWMPLLVGYMLGRSLGGSPAFSQPLYRTQNDTTFRTGDNRAVTTRTGAQSVPMSTTSSSFKTSTIARGGFGANARSYGSSSSRIGGSSVGG